MTGFIRRVKVRAAAQKGKGVLILAEMNTDIALERLTHACTHTCTHTHDTHTHTCSSSVSSLAE